MQQLQSIIAVTDLTQNSDAGLHAAAYIAPMTGARLRVINALPGQLPLTEYLRLVFTPNRFAGAQARALQKQLDRVLQHDIEVDISANLDPTADWVVQQARAAQAGLIVISKAAGSDLIAAVAEQALLPVLIVDGKFDWPISRAIMPIASPVPNRDAIALAKSWTELLSAGTESGAGAPVELELLQMVYISAESGSAAAAVRALRSSSSDSVKLSWRAAPAEPPARQVRRLAARADAQLIISPLRIRRENASSAKLSSLNRSILRASGRPVLILPVLRQAAAAIA